MQTSGREDHYIALIFLQSRSDAFSLYTFGVAIIMYSPIISASCRMRFKCCEHAPNARVRS